MKNEVVWVFFKRATVLESHQNEKHSGKYFFGLTMIFPFLSLMFSVIRLFFKNHFHQVIPTFAFFVIIGGKGCTVAPSDDLFLCNDILLARSLRLFHFTIFFSIFRCNGSPHLSRMRENLWPEVKFKGSSRKFTLRQEISLLSL